MRLSLQPAKMSLRTALLNKSGIGIKKSVSIAAPVEKSGIETKKSVFALWGKTRIGSLQIGVSAQTASPSGRTHNVFLPAAPVEKSGPNGKRSVFAQSASSSGMAPNVSLRTAPGDKYGM